MFTYVVRTIHDDENVITYAYPKVLASTNPKDGFARYYAVFNDKNRYLQERIGTKENIRALANDFSFYSLVFYDTNEKNTPVHFLQTNFTENANLYDYFLPDNIDKRKKKERLVQLTPMEEDKENVEKNNEPLTTSTNETKSSHEELYGMSEAEKKKSIWNARVFNNFSLPPRSRVYLFQYPNFKGRSFVFENDKNSHITYNIEFMLDDDVSSYKWFTTYPNAQKFKTPGPEQILRRPVLSNVGYQINEEIIQRNPDLNLPTIVVSEDSNSDIIISKLHAT